MIILPIPARMTGTEQEQIDYLRSYLMMLVTELENQMDYELDDLEERLTDAVDD